MKFFKMAAAAGLLMQAVASAHATQTYRTTHASHHRDVLTARLRLIESPHEIEATVATSR